MRLQVLENRFPDIIRRLGGAEVERLVRQAAEEVIDEVRRDMEKPKHGRWYGGHRASAPGEAPAIRTETLYWSLRARRLSPFEYEASSDVEYDAYLEFGTSRMAPRPHWVPAAERVQPRYTRAGIRFLETL